MLSTFDYEITLAVPLTREASTLQVGHPPLGPRSLTQDEYLTIAKAQLREIIEMFGDEGPLEVWFDVRAATVGRLCIAAISDRARCCEQGGTGPSAVDIGPTVHAAAPNAVCHSCESNFTDAGGIRWMGNEEG